MFLQDSFPICKWIYDHSDDEVLFPDITNGSMAIKALPERIKGYDIIIIIVI